MLLNDNQAVHNGVAVPSTNEAYFAKIFVIRKSAPYLQVCRINWAPL